ncbi:MAG TPA: ABC transporter permease [Vicinamibacterales bacterium]|nr:ABC transporter permease [Vicinamibacterales bacterium]
MSDWVATFKHAIRTLRRQPTFALVAIVTLALGIGANTAIFSVIKTVVLNPLPYASPEQIAVLWEVNPDGNQGPVSVPTYEDWKRDAKGFETLAAYRHVDFSFKGTGDPQNVPGLKATPELFTVLRSNAALGRTFTSDESVVGADRVVVLSHGFWSRTLGGDASIVGRPIQLDSVPYTVVGVMPPAFEFPTSTNVEVWTPLAFDPKDMHGRSRRARSLTVIGRMAGSAESSAQQAVQVQRELDVISARIAADFKDSNAGWGARVVAAHDQLVGASRPALIVLMGAVGFLLLIVCANMANLLLARLSSRRREMAVRGALGASRWEVARPVIAESLVLSFIGGAIGLVIANVGLRLLGTMEEARLPRLEALQLDGGVLLFTLIVCVGVALAFGVLPALHASRQELRDVMHESSGSTGSPYARRVLSGLVVVEVALALVLLVGAGLMTRSFSKLLEVNPGFEADNLIAARVLLPSTKYTRATQVGFYEAVLERVRREPGVVNASAVSAMPLHDVGAAGALPFNVEGQQPPPTEDPLADVRIVAPGYFETMKIRLIDGRFLDERDALETPRTSVINETMARRYFPNESPLGRTIQNPHGRSQVVGIVGDVHNQGLDREPRKQVYLPMRQSPTAGMALVARTERDAATFANAITRAIWDVDPSQPVYEMSTMDQILARAVFLPRLSTTLLAMFALAALLLAALGIYGVLSYSVTQRTREIGLRMALGASGGNTVAMIVRSSVGMVAIGGAVGLGAAVLLARSMAGILYGVGPFDLPAFALALVTLLIAGVVASLLPALRSTRVDPVIALRDQ